MYAIIEVGGKQEKVEVGKYYFTEKVNANVGEKIEFDCLLVSDGKKVQTEASTAKGVKVVAEVLEHGKGDKITVYKYKAKKNERKKQGHRQPYSKLKIVSIG